MTSADQRIFERAVASLQTGALDEAERGLVKFLRRNPKHFGALNLFGMLLAKQARYGEAETVLGRAIGMDGQSDATFYNYGIVLKALNRPTDALEAFNKAITINPSVPESWSNRGTVLNDLRNFDGALKDFDRAIALKPDYAEALLNKGNSLTELRRYDEALAAYDQALALKSDLAEAWCGRGNAYFILGRYEDALKSFDKVRTINPSLKYFAGRCFHTKLQLCDWRDFDREGARIVADVRAGRPVSRPFDMLAISSSPKDHLKCAQLYAAEIRSTPAVRLLRGKRNSHDRIRLAYVSADFYHHATTLLAVDLFERHDRTKFEVLAISFSPDDGSDMRARVVKTFDQFHDVYLKNDIEIAKLINDLEVDIAVDLKGYTAEARPRIFAQRPAPIQVNYLGYPGTMGTDFIDYIIADKIVLPFEQQPYFTEKIIHLPDSYQVNDTKRKISTRAYTRPDAGLAEQGFVFCCFNNSYKITPAVFDVWMRILASIDNSVLCLLSNDEALKNNLCKEAKVRGVDPARLVFVGRTTYEEHLARHRLADLFLDTLPYNAHTTASDALWAGLPVLTCRGEAFAGRVGASLLQAAELPELVTENLADYEALALKLAREPALLAGIKAKLARNRDVCPLFNTERVTRHIEAAYATMWEIFQRGEVPKSFAVTPL